MAERGRQTPVDGISWTIRDALDWATRSLRAAGQDSARFESEELLAFALQTERLTLYVHPRKMVQSETLLRFQELVRQRMAGTPAAYIVGHVDFYKTQLKISPRVLIPRAETEELVEKIVGDFLNKNSVANHHTNLIDLGTGSGAIAIALLKEWPNATAVAVDISADALHVARENAVSNGVDSRITLLQSDWMEAVTGPFDLVVSNPPYIPTSELNELSKEVIDHEPRIALDGGPDGVSQIERILSKAPQVLRPGCPIYLEIGYNQREAVEGLLRKSAAYVHWEVFKDLAGRDRIVRAYRRGD